MHPRWLSRKELGQYLGIRSLKTIDRLLSDGLPFSRLPSGTIRINTQDADDFMRQYRVGSQPEVQREAEAILSKFLR